MATFASGSPGSSCSTMYQSTPAALAASTIAGNSSVPSPTGASAASDQRRDPSCGAAGRGGRLLRPPPLGHARRPRPNTGPVRVRPRVGVRPGGCPRSSSRRAVRTRNRGCDSRGVIPSRAIRRACPPSSAANRLTSSAVARSASGIHGTITRGQPTRPGGRPRLRRRHAGARSPRVRRRRRPTSSSIFSRPAGATSGRPASSTARYPASATDRRVPTRSTAARRRTVYSWSAIWSSRIGHDRARPAPASAGRSRAHSDAVAFRP